MESKIALCTLYEGDYHFGLGAFANSLHASGFHGNLWVGTRGERPPWMPSNSRDIYELPGGMSLRFCDIDTPYHLSNYKPWWMNRIFDDLAPDADVLGYFDPDIVVKAPWSFYADWLSWGIAVVGDFYEQLGEEHLFRHHWRRFAGECGLPFVRPVDRGYNGGVLSLRRQDRSYLDTWATLIEALPKLGLPIDSLLPTGKLHAFRYTDQDLLNVAIECGDWPIASLPPSGMDLRGQIGEVMCHMTPGVKPWRTGYFIGKHRWRERSHMSRMYWRFANGPIRMYSDGQLLARKLDQKAAAVFGRLYSIPAWEQ